MTDPYLLAAVRDLLAEYDETGHVTAVEIEALRAMLYSHDLKTLPGMRERIIEQEKLMKQTLWNPFGSVDEALNQASIMRRCAMAWDDDGPLAHFKNGPVRNVLGLTRTDCVRKAREALAWAKQMRGKA